MNRVFEPVPESEYTHPHSWRDPISRTPKLTERLFPYSLRIWDENCRAVNVMFHESSFSPASLMLSLSVTTDHTPSAYAGGLNATYREDYRTWRSASHAYGIYAFTDNTLISRYADLFSQDHGKLQQCVTALSSRSCTHLPCVRPFTRA